LVDSAWGEILVDEKLQTVFILQFEKGDIGLQQSIDISRRKLVYLFVVGRIKSGSMVESQADLLFIFVGDRDGIEAEGVVLEIQPGSFVSKIFGGIGYGNIVKLLLGSIAQKYFSHIVEVENSSCVPKEDKRAAVALDKKFKVSRY
jgi:hypothetical protein